MCQVTNTDRLDSRPQVVEQYDSLTITIVIFICTFIRLNKVVVCGKSDECAYPPDYPIAGVSIPNATNNTSAIPTTHLQGMGTLPYSPYNIDSRYLMTSSNGNIFRVTGHLWWEFTGDRWIPPHWWFETPSRSLWRHLCLPENPQIW